MVPGLGLQPFLLSNSSAISCPCIAFFESIKRIRNDNNPRISQHPPFFMVLDALFPI